MSTCTEGRPSVKGNGTFYLGSDVNKRCLSFVGAVSTKWCPSIDYNKAAHIQGEHFAPEEGIYLATDRNNLCYFNPVATGKYLTDEHLSDLLTEVSYKTSE